MSILPLTVKTCTSVIKLKENKIIEMHVCLAKCTHNYIVLCGLQVIQVVEIKQPLFFIFYSKVMTREQNKNFYRVPAMFVGEVQKHRYSRNLKEPGAY